MTTGPARSTLPFMAGAPEMFNVRVSFDAGEGRDVVQGLVDALNDDGLLLAPMIGVTYEKGYATMEFEPVPNDPGAGPTAAEGSMPGAEIVAALEGFSHEHSPVVAIVRALLTMSAARERAALSPRREIRIEAVPAVPLPQDALSSHRSEHVHPRRRRFGDARAG
jgi:hypothetical protein